MNRQKQMKQNKKGFTLAELLVVIAIMMILAGVSFVAINRYIRNLHVLEMDNTAKEIFIVAQNHLSQSYASGEYQREYEDHKDDFGVVLDEKPKYLSGTGDPSTNGAEPEYRYMLFTGYSEDGSGTDERTGVLSIMLPKFSIEEEIVDEGNFVIAYEVHTATVLGVFYSGKTHTYFGSSPIHDFTADEAEENGNTDLYEAREDREIRKHYKDNTVIGCYVADGKDTIPEESLKPLILHLNNGSQLTATIINPNYKTDSSRILTLFVHGLTSDNTQIIQLESSGSAFNTAYKNKNGPEAASEVRSYANIGYSTDGTKEETYKFILDDVTRQNGHFCDAFKYLIPGEDVEVYAELSDTSSIAAPVKSNIETSNSLFDAFSPDSQGGIAEIGNIRHLENLDPEVSNLSFIADSSGIESSAPTLVPLISEINVKKAVQIKDLIYSGSGSFTSDISESDSSDGSTLKIYKFNGTTELSTKGYYGISNSNLISYDGQGLNIERIHSETGADGNTGIFAETEVSDSSNPAKYFLIKNLTVNNSEFIAAANAGGFVGANLGNLRIHNCKFSVDPSVEKEVKAVGGDAGAMVGHSKGILEIINSGVTGAKLSVSSSGSDAAGLVAHSEGTLTVTNCIVKGDGLNIKSSSGDAGGIAAKCDAAAIIKSGHVIGDNIKIDAGTSDAGGILGNAAGAVTMESCSASGKKFDLKAGNAGGIIGNAAAAVDMKSSSTSGEEFTITAQRGGGIIGNADGLVTMERCSAIGRKYKITGADAGGIIGTSSGGLNINNTYGSSFIEATANAGGFIGNINAGSSNLIKNCYAAGHTKGGKYGKKPEVTDETEYYNVISAGVAGGFIGRNSVNTSVDNSYSTCSVYSSSNSATEGFAGGFVGRSTVLEVNNCYSAGPVSIKSGGTAGGFAGQGVSASGQSYYLKGKGFNAVLGAGGSGNIANISSTTGAEISSAGSDYDAKPWDDHWKIHEDSGVYPYKTIAELSGVSADLSMHYGDWAKPEPNNISLNISNAEKLSAILVVPTVTLGGAGGNYASLVIEGMDSGKIAYMQLELQQGVVNLINKTQALSNIAASGGATTGSDNVVFPEVLSYKITTAQDNTEFHIYLDDVTRAGFNFASVFTGFTPGEDIRLSVDSGFVSWSALIEQAEEQEAVANENEVKSTGITNSLFADGSGNGDYHSTSYYSDIHPDTAIVNPGSTASAYNDTALILNFRHLQNLDKYVSNVGSNYKKAKLCRNLYWAAANTSHTNVMSSVYKDFITAIQTESGNIDAINIYPYDSTDAVAVSNTFYGIINDNLKEFDGGCHSINNVLIYNVQQGTSGTYSKANPDAGLFRYVGTNSGITMSIHDLTMIEPVVVTSKGNAGGLIGNVKNEGKLQIEYVYIYGKDSLVRTLSSDFNSSGPNAGGLIGTATGGAYTIGNCGASAYVYAASRCAGGFIGDFKPKATTTVTDCFVGGHVEDGTEEYVDNEAVIGDTTTITNQGGYNVCGYVASGGFIGFIGTDIAYTTTISRCFTTASVHAVKPATGDNDSSKGATGGFIGRMQFRYQKYSQCYVAGKIFAGSSMAGAFVGHHNKTGTTLSEDELPKYENDYVLMGLNFNDDMELELVNYGSQPGYSVSGISFIEHNAAEIVNENSDYVDVITFNKESNVYPYRDNSINKDSTGTEHYVFYGDWMEPEKKDPLSLINGNRLTASVDIRPETRGTVNIGGLEYDVTYIKVTGAVSGNNIVYRIIYKNGVVYKTERNQWGNWVNVYADGTVSAEINNGKVDFYIDDISKKNGCYYLKALWPLPGENITVHVSNSEAGLNSDAVLPVTGNSLFERIEDNHDGSYTAYIANSRNLMNLNNTVSGIYNDNVGIKISKAIQTDNIYWADNGSGWNARTQPYQTEIPGGAIYEHWGELGTASGIMMALQSFTLESYDGAGYTLYNVNINKNTDNAGIGLFSFTKRDLTIQNLNINNPNINESGSSNYVAVLVGKVDHNLRVENVVIEGNISVKAAQHAGGVIGYSDGNIIMNHVLVKGNMTVWGNIFAGGIIAEQDGGSLQMNDVGISAGTGIIRNNSNEYGSSGGLIGQIKNNASLNIKNCFTSVYIEGYGVVAGGFIGNIDNCTGKIAKSYASGHTYNGEYIDSNEYSVPGHYNVIGDHCNAVGGFIGKATGTTDKVQIEKCLSTNSVASNMTVNWYYLGGFAGSIGNNIDVKNCYSISQINGGISANMGVFAGDVSGNATVASSWVLKRSNNTAIAGIGHDGNIAISKTVFEGTLDFTSIPDGLKGDAAEPSLSYQTYHHDPLYPSERKDYPFKNWTNANDNSDPSDVPLIVFYGDW